MRPTTALLVLATLVAGAAAPAPVRADDAWYPSKYGADDTLGAINELSPEGVLAAVQLVKTGKTYALGIETGRDTPAYGARSFQLYAVANGDGSGDILFGAKNRPTYNDDWMLTWLGVGTQIDGLGHFGIDHVYYNGNRVQDFWRPTGLAKFATHELPPIVTRGVLLDVAGHRGVDQLEGGTEIGRAEVEAVAKKQGTPLRRGDVVIFHTGWQAMAKSDPATFLATEPGIGVEAAEYLAGLGVVAVGADTFALEVSPGPDPQNLFPVHQILLAKNGVYILENIRTDELAADGAHEFLFVLGQPRFVGAVQMVINPVAIR